ncbi:LytR/AlgR family response regulator transcription factor [Sphingomonas sp. GCM10030256]|uniref:LytR/AlgR family response regulator transcription factor n=1 Tax=Sphingomonas sp. GCM10030256 TaxID=3273427 RepID=UPI0036113923
MRFDRVLGAGGESVWRRLLLAAAFFWFFSYVIMSLRGLVVPVALPVLSGRRLFSTLSGALLFVGAAIALRRAEPASVPARGALMLLASVTATACLFAIQTLAEHVFSWSPPITAGDQVGWLLMWAGYFGAWLTAVVPVRRREKAAATVEPEPASTQTAPTALEPMASDTLWVQSNRETIRVPVREIEWIEAEGNYARIHAAGGKGLVRASLRSLQGQLADHGFVRVHRSTLCRKDSIRSLRRSGANLRVVLESGSELAVGRAYAAELTNGLNL